MAHSFLSLPIEVRYRIYELYKDCCDFEPRELILRKVYAADQKRYCPSLANVHHGWRNLLSTCRQIREDVLSIFWREYPVVLQPLVDRCVNFALEWPLHQLVVEVRPKNEVRNCCAISWKDLEILTLLGVRHPTLNQIDVAMDLSNLIEMAPPSRSSNCPDHARKLSNSLGIRQMIGDISTHKTSGGFMHFRIHFSKSAEKRSRSCIAQYNQEYASTQNHAAKACEDHEVGECHRLTCRFLHAIEEVYGHPVNTNMLGAYLTFFGYDREDDERSYVFETSCDLMPIMVDAPLLYDIKEGTSPVQIINSERLLMRYDWRGFEASSE